MLSRRRLSALLSATALLRLAHLVAVRDAPFVGQLALDSQEYDRWARAIAAGDWLGSAPFFQAPLYPYLVALVYRSPGRGADRGLPAADRASPSSAAGRWCGPARHSPAPAPQAPPVWLFALYTPFWFYDVQLMKESFAVSAVCLLLFLLLKARSSDRLCALVRGRARRRVSRSAAREHVVGRAVSAPAHVVAKRPVKGGRGLCGGVVCCLLGLSLPLSVVAARNAALGGGFLPTTSQGGVNFWIGNNPSADGTYRPLVPGKQVPAYEREGARILAEQALGRPLAADEVSGLLAAAFAVVGARRAAFVRPPAVRQARSLLGRLRVAGRGGLLLDEDDLAAARPAAARVERGGAAGALGATARAPAARASGRRCCLFELGWMLSVVAFFVFSRYRLPAVPGLLLLAAIPLARAAEAFSKGDRRKSGAMWAGVAILWLAPHVPGYAPRVDLVEFNLGRLAEERGDLAAAASHYERTLAADPDNLSATLNLGTLAARAGDYATARTRFERAVALAPDSDDAHANLGGALLALGDLPGAERELDRALELNPENRFARHNLEVLARRSAEPAFP